MEVSTMTRLCLRAIALSAALSVAPVAAQQPTYRFSDPTVLVGPGSSIGVRVRDLTTADLKNTGTNSVEGAFVESVESGTPAEKAGLKSGDVIVEFDGERVRGGRTLSRLVSETPPKRTVKTTIVRAGVRRSMDVTPETGLVRSGRNFTGILPAN
jgi:C-terminal processing protease CtpA/Prc